MKNKFIVIAFIFFSIMLSTILVNAIDISVENYYPTPAEAGDYFTVWLKALNREDFKVEKPVIRLKASYPFSLDPGEQQEVVVDEIEAKSSVTRSFKIRVDKQAKEGNNTISFEYKDCEGCVWQEKTMAITVVEFQTMFDVVLQEINSEGVFIAVANIGKNPANAVTVSIPEQDYFTTDLISASIVGNLDSGDYTIAGFKILSKQRNIREKQDLFVQIDYTDPFGTRRTVVEKVLLNPSSLSGVSSNFTGTQFTGTQGRNTQSSSFLTNIWFWVSLVLLGIIAFLLRRDIKRRIYMLK